jgi:hypothetical protein
VFFIFLFIFFPHSSAIPHAPARPPPARPATSPPMRYRAAQCSTPPAGTQPHHPSPRPSRPPLCPTPEVPVLPQRPLRPTPEVSCRLPPAPPHPSATRSCAARSRGPCRRPVFIEEAKMVVGHVGRELVESIGLCSVAMAGIWPDSGEFRGKARPEIA